MVLMGGIFAAVGAILILIGVIVGRRAAATDQLLATGLAGTATVTGLTQTGMYLNDQPQIAMDLLVDVPGRAPYAASTTNRAAHPARTTVIGRSAGGARRSGRPAAPDRRLAVDRPRRAGSRSRRCCIRCMPLQRFGGTVDESLSQVQAALTASGMQGVAPPFAMAEQANFTVEQLRDYLRQSGLEASATVDTLEDTGSIQGDERVYTMEMTLNIPGQPPKKLPKSAAMVPITQSHKLYQGMTVPVRYAAQNPDLLMVEWDKI